MAVIVTNMDMPRGCFECPLREDHGWDGDWCAVSEGYDLIAERTRPDYCPLKSTDEMIAEIEDKICSFNYFASEVTTRDAILKIIHKYCDKEQKDGNDD